MAITEINKAHSLPLAMTTGKNTVMIQRFTLLLIIGLNLHAKGARWCDMYRVERGGG